MYRICLSHHSIGCIEVMQTAKSLSQAKRLATKELGEEFENFSIVIRDARGEIKSTRRIAADRWVDADQY